MNKKYEDLIQSESAHQDKKISSLDGSKIRHSSLEKFAESSLLSSFYASPFLSSKKSLRILELGCGTGGNAIRLASQGHHVCSIDISPESIEYAKRGAEQAGVKSKIEFKLCDAMKIGDVFEVGQFDFVCGVGILHHVENMQLIVEKIKKLEPRGIAFIEALGTNPLYGVIRRFLVGKTHTIDEHPLTNQDLLTIKKMFPNVQLKFGGAFIPYLLWPTKPLTNLDEFISNKALLWRLAKTVAIVSQDG